MYLSLHDIKHLLFVGLTAFGAIAVLVAIYLLASTTSSPDALFLLVSGLPLIFVGASCIFFGIETYLLRNEPDIWK